MRRRTLRRVFGGSTPADTLADLDLLTRKLQRDVTGRFARAGERCPAYAMPGARCTHSAGHRGRHVVAGP